MLIRIILNSVDTTVTDLKNLCMNEREILSNEYLLSSLIFPESNYSLYLVSHHCQPLNYFFFKNGYLLFSGSDIPTSPSHDLESIEVITTVLFWLCIRPADTDDEFFINYTTEQKQWSTSTECLHLSYYIADFENNDSHNHSDAYNFFTQHFKLYAKNHQHEI